MKIGISTASLFPIHTEDALLEVARLGVKDIEIFLNSVYELRGEVFSSIQNTINEYRLNVFSFHPFSSPLETLFLFSAYDRRVTEIMDLYKRYFEIMNKINPCDVQKIFVIHGAAKTGKCSDGQYVERLGSLIEAGDAAGVTVAQENVSYCKSGDIHFLEMLKRELGASAKFVLDIKQVKRAGANPLHFVKSLGDSIVHLHLSDSNHSDDCMKIGAGGFDFAELFSALKNIGYKGDAVVELYRENYDEYCDLSDCVEILKKLL